MEPMKSPVLESLVKRLSEYKFEVRRIHPTPEITATRLQNEIDHFNRMIEEGYDLVKRADLIKEVVAMLTICPRCDGQLTIEFKDGQVHNVVCKSCGYSAVI